jgi:hypothetical protein
MIAAVQTTVSGVLMDILQAAQTGDTSAVLAALARGDSPNTRDDVGSHPALYRCLLISHTITTSYACLAGSHHAGGADATDACVPGGARGSGGFAAEERGGS